MLAELMRLCPNCYGLSSAFFGSKVCCSRLDDIVKKGAV